MLLISACFGTHKNVVCRLEMITRSELMSGISHLNNVMHTLGRAFEKEKEAFNIK